MTALAILRARAWQVAIAVDQLANAMLGGWADETLSSRAWRAEQRGRRPGVWLRPLIDALFWWQPHRCRTSYESERAAIQLPPEFRKTPAEQAAPP